jgi:hypothetical protein
MSGKQEQAAIQAVARHFGATWEAAGNGFNISIGGTRIAVEVTTLDQRIDGTRPRLRSDKVARRLIGRLQAALFVPDGITVLLTITAPIRHPSKTAEALEEQIGARLEHRPTQLLCKDTIHGNQVQFLFIRSTSRQRPRVIGLVHDPAADPGMLLNLTGSLLEQIGTAAEKPTPAGSSIERWLVVSADGGPVQLGTYRQIYRQLPIPTGFAKIIMVFDGDRVGSLTG